MLNFQDQGKVFDDTFRQFQELKENLNNFKSHFAAETNGIPVLSKCMELLAARCGMWYSYTPSLTSVKSIIKFIVFELLLIQNYADHLIGFGKEIKLHLITNDLRVIYTHPRFSVIAYDKRWGLLTEFFFEIILTKKTL